MTEGKELLVSDESVNSRGLIVRTKGGDFTRFEQNPIMLFNHVRASLYASKDSILPIGTWKDLRIVGTEIFATPVFDDDEDDFAKKIAGKYERKVIRSASIGIYPIKVSYTEKGEGEDDEVIVEEWQLREISICDIPSNENAVAFYSKDDEPLELNAVIEMATGTTTDIPTTTKIQTMDKFQFVPTVLGLSADATPEDVQKKIVELQAQQAEVIRLKAENAELQKVKAEVQKQKVVSLVDAAVADNKIDAREKEHYVKLATGNYDTVKNLLDGMKAKAKEVNLSDVPKKKIGGSAVTDKFTYEGMTFSEMQKNASAKLIELKASNFATFNKLYKAEFDKDYKV